MTQSFSVITYNIHKGFSASGRRFILEQIKQALEELDADLLLLQEIQGEHQGKAETVDDWPPLSQEQFIAEPCWPHHVYGRNAVYSKGHHGNAILSRHPLGYWENINVALMKTHSRSLLHSEVNIPGLEQTLHVICVHLGLFSRERKRQFKSLIRRIETHVPDSAPLIIAGDFNDWLGHADRYLHEELDIQEAFREMHRRFAKTFPAWRPVLRMDRIYYRGLELQECLAPRGMPWRQLSDHIPLMARFGCCKK
jgi:endonuclease/exonuclease/phosphatase family metal-dependent hydrolase